MGTPARPAPGHRRRHGVRLALVALLVGVTLALVPLAYACPPDETWLGGVWDDDDFDNVIIAVRSTAALVDQPAYYAKPVFMIVEEVAEPVVLPEFSEPDRVYQPRSPPV
jgi:hypothetical protein